MKLTVKNKLTGIGVLALLSYALLVILTVHENSKIEKSTKYQEHAAEEVEVLTEMRRNMLHVLLQAALTVQERDAGKIDPKRMASMEKELEYLNSHAKDFRIFAKELDREDVADKFDHDLEILNKTIRVDLVEGIAQRKDDKYFKGLDHVLDKEGTNMLYEIEAILYPVEKKLQKAIQSNLATIEESTFFVEMIGVVSGGVFAVLLYFIMIGITRPLDALRDTMGVLATGDTDVNVPALDKEDEIGEMARVTDKLREESAQSLLTKFALDNVTANVMIANADHDIMYMNDAIIEMLQAAESDIRKDLPRFDVSKLLGENIDTFHKNPAHQRGMLDGMTGTYQANIVVGGRTFALTANPIHNVKEERAGTVVEWKDITQELSVQEEVDLVVSKVAAGDFSQNISVEGKSGFMLNLSEGVNSMIASVSEAVDEVVTMLSALAEGDLTKRIEADFKGMYQKLKEDANKTADQLSEIISRISGSTDTISHASSEVAAGSSDLSHRTEQQASSLEETAASMEELASTVKRNADNAQNANKLSAEANNVATEGGEVVTNAVDAMSKIEESSRKISDIIGVIDEIAFQTNLLALNAAVEAARAGDAGKGFAVVASEVRTLAQRSAEASKEIKALIVDSNDQVKDGVDLVNRAGESLEGILASVKEVSGIVSEIASASQEQASGIDEINTAVSQMDEMTQKNAALVEESTAAARSMEEQADELKQLVRFFNIDEDETQLLGSNLGGGSANASNAASAPKVETYVEDRSSRVEPAGAGDGDWEEF